MILIAETAPTALELCIKLAVNIIAFQVTWFACVLGAVHNWPSLGVAAGAVTVLIHLSLSDTPAADLKLIVFAIVLGLLMEGTLIYAGLTKFVSSGPASTVLAPPWLLAMWAAFGTLPNMSLKWLQSRPSWLAALLGGVGGPLAYIAGEKLGGVTLLEPRFVAITAIAIAWAVATVLLIRASANVNQRSHS